jgi:uncharacterized protein YjiS (DUF1127 family)
MKIANSVTTTPFDVARGTEFSDRLHGWTAGLISRFVAAAQAAYARRRLAAALMSLDDRILRDIGISEPEIWNLRARRRLLPPDWD